LRRCSAQADAGDYDGIWAPDLDGWTLADEADHVYTFDDVSIDADETVTVYTGAGTDSETALCWGDSIYLSGTTATIGNGS